MVDNKTFFDGDLNSPISCCIAIASHISNAKRIGHLFECLDSLVNQTIVIPIYLSISFENQELNQMFGLELIKRTYLHTDALYLYIRDKKTAQMRHLDLLYPVIKEKYNWMMFCDDDDTYVENRVEVYLQLLQKYHMEVNMLNKDFVGIYESEYDKDHRNKRHEYWCYCIKPTIFNLFMETIRQYPDVLDNTCCDVFFAEYMRRLGNQYVFAYISDKYYNYRVDNNDDSITGAIRKSTKIIRKPRLDLNETNSGEIATELNGYLNENLSIYLHDIFLYSIVGSNFDDILKLEFKTEYGILSMIDEEHINKMRTLHEYLREIANQIYDVKL